MIDKCCIFGLGYTASFLLPRLRSLQVDVYAITRQPVERRVQQAGLTWNSFSLPEVDDALQGATHVLITAPPAAPDGDPVLAKFSAVIARHAHGLQWLGYLSSTSVYGDHQGRWVDEASASMQPGLAGQLRLQAEMAWFALAKQHDLPLHVFRLAGIYGPGRHALQRVVERHAPIVVKDGQFFSRIHVEDLVSSLLLSMLNPKPMSIYNVADDEPAGPHDVERFALKVLHLPPREEVPYAMATLSPRMQAFYQDNRRVSNRKLKHDLSFVLQYPTYREGLLALALLGKN